MNILTLGKHVHERREALGLTQARLARLANLSRQTVQSLETAAEIVAKKMYHRGAIATARDVFDLAMVIEREPDALIDAIPFMRRHLDAFLEHLRSPSDNFITQFNSIQRINYSPTFEHAAELTIRYLVQLPR